LYAILSSRLVSPLGCVSCVRHSSRRNPPFFFFVFAHPVPHKVLRVFVSRVFPVVALFRCFPCNCPCLELFSPLQRVRRFSMGSRETCILCPTWPSRLFGLPPFKGACPRFLDRYPPHVGRVFPIIVFDLAPGDPHCSPCVLARITDVIRPSPVFPTR